LIIDDVESRLTFASDVVNDGVYLELQDSRLWGHQTILMAFRSDTTGAVTITAYEASLPFFVVAKFLDAARAEWPTAVGFRSRPTTPGAGT
jgi:hypothetical protein